VIAKLVFNPADKDALPHYKNNNTLRSILDGTPLVFSELVKKGMYVALDRKGNIVGQGEIGSGKAKEQSK
jgi:hypothetical protein